MYLLICVVNNTASVNEIVGGLVRIGVTGATVIDSHGTAEIAAAQVPVFAGFRHLVQSTRQPNRTLFSVIKDDETLDRAMAVVENVVGSLEGSATGIMFAIPVTRVVGLAAKMEDSATDDS
jgi:nitrogen regulatory protein P-II 1